MSQQQMPSASSSRWLSQRDTFGKENVEWEEVRRLQFLQRGTLIVIES